MKRAIFGSFAVAAVFCVFFMAVASASADKLVDLSPPPNASVFGPFPGKIDPVAMIVTISKGGERKFTAIMTESNKIQEIRFYDHDDRDFLKKFTKKIRANVKDEELCQIEATLDSLRPKIVFPPSVVRLFLEEYLIEEEGVEGKDLGNYEIYAAHSGVNVSGFSFLELISTEKRYRIVEIYYYDKRMILEKISQGQPKTP